MDIYNFDNQNNLFGDDIDDILLNPVYYLNQYESNQNNNINTNCAVRDSIEIPENKKHISLNSTFNTNNALDEGSQNINFNFSFFSFNNGNQQIEQKKEMSQKSIDILSEFISKEKKIVENNFIEIEEDKKLKLLKIKELKNNFEKLEQSLNIFFKKPFMRKNYEKKKFFEKFENNCDEEEKKISISKEINIDIDEKYKDKKINYNNINNINEI